MSEFTFQSIVRARESVDVHCKRPDYTAEEHHARMVTLRDAIDAFAAELPDWLSPDQKKTIRMYIGQSWYTWNHYDMLLTGMLSLR